MEQSQSAIIGGSEGVPCNCGPGTPHILSVNEYSGPRLKMNKGQMVGTSIVSITDPNSKRQSHLEGRIRVANNGQIHSGQIDGSPVRFQRCKRERNTILACNF